MHFKGYLVLQDSLFRSHSEPLSCSVLVSRSLLHKQGSNIPHGYLAHSPKAATDQEKEGKENHTDKKFTAPLPNAPSSLSGLDGKLN